MVYYSIVLRVSVLFAGLDLVVGMRCYFLIRGGYLLRILVWFGTVISWVAGLLRFGFELCFWLVGVG